MHGYWWYDTYAWSWPFHGIGPILGLLLIVALAWILLRDRRPPTPKEGWSWPQPPGAESARDILDKRYARGEITKDQYEAMKRDLGGQ